MQRRTVLDRKSFAKGISYIWHGGQSWEEVGGFGIVACRHFKAGRAGGGNKLESTTFRPVLLDSNMVHIIMDRSPKIERPIGQAGKLGNTAVESH